MKKQFAILLSFVLLVSLCACGQDSEPTTEPIPESTAACEHTYEDATCAAPKTCSKCGATEGEPAEHAYTDGTCTTCGQVLFTGCRWKAQIVRAATADDEYGGDVLSILYYDAAMMNVFSQMDYHSVLVDGMTPYGQVEHSGKTYYNYSFSGIMAGITYTDNGDTVTVQKELSGDSVTLTRTGKTQFTVTAISGTDFPPVGTVFEFVAPVAEG